VSAEAAPAAESAMHWSKAMKLLVAFAAMAVIVVVVVGGLVLATSGPLPLQTKVVNFSPAALTSVVDSCSQGNGTLRVAGTTTAAKSVFIPAVTVFGVNGSNDPQGAQHTVHLRTTLHQGGSWSWKAVVPEPQPASGCTVVTNPAFVLPGRG
jgi:hypothetical protein